MVLDQDELKDIEFLVSAVEEMEVAMSLIEIDSKGSDAPPIPDNDNMEINMTVVENKETPDDFVRSFFFIFAAILICLLILHFSKGKYESVG